MKKVISLLAASTALVAVSPLPTLAAPPASPAPAENDFSQDRAAYRASIPSMGQPDEVASVQSLTIPATRPTRAIPIRVYTPQGAVAGKALPIIVFIHGGGFTAGDLDTHDVMVRALANRTHAIVVTPQYRLAPENPYPAGLDDAYATLQWAAANATKFNGDGKRIAVSGDSAGGNIAAVLAMVSRDRKGPRIVAQLLMYPTLSNKMDTASWKAFGDTNFPTRAINTRVIKAYVPKGTSLYAPLVAPLWGDHRKLPPAHIVVGGDDPLRDEALDYAKALNQKSVEAKAVVYPGNQHGFVQYFKDKEHYTLGEAALDDGAAFLRAKLGMN